MPTKLTQSAVYALVITLCAASGVWAQRFQPFGPVDTDPTIQLWAPAELGDFGNAPPPAEGFFLTYARLAWDVSAPRRRPIGQPSVRPVIFDGTSTFTQSNSIDVAVPSNKSGWGNRWDLGYIEDRTGWVVSILDGPFASAKWQYGFGDNGAQDVSVIFSDPEGLLKGFVNNLFDSAGGFDDDVNGNGVFGRDGIDTNGNGFPDAPAPTDFGDQVDFPVYFHNLQARFVTEINGVELMKIWQHKPAYFGGIWNFYLGARYLQLDDRYFVDAVGGVLDDSNWNSKVLNNMVGPQMALRWAHQRDRWRFAAEARYMLAANFQDVSVWGELGTEVPPRGGTNRPTALTSTTFRSTARDVDYSSVGELRVDFIYQLAKAVAVKVGWTGLYMGGTARAAGVIDYSLPRMGILSGNPQEHTFSHGITLGVEVNK